MASRGGILLGMRYNHDRRHVLFTSGPKNCSGAGIVLCSPVFNAKPLTFRYNFSCLRDYMRPFRLIFMASIGSLWAQSTTGTILGTVMDSSKSVIHAAKV